MAPPSLPLVLRPGFEVFLGSPHPPLLAASSDPLLAFRPLSEDKPDCHRLRFLHGACSTCRRRLTALGFLSLQHLPDIGSPLLGGLPHLSRCAFRVSYPLSGLLLPKPLSHLSGPSAPGIRPSEFCSLQRSVPLSRSPALLPFTRWDPLSPNNHVVRLQSFHPFEEPGPRCPLSRRTSKPFLSWASPPLGFPFFRPFRPLQAVSSSALFSSNVAV